MSDRQSFKCPSCHEANKSEEHIAIHRKAFYDGQGQFKSTCKECGEALYLSEEWKYCLRPMTPDYKKERPILFKRK